MTSAALVGALYAPCDAAKMENDVSDVVGGLTPLARQEGDVAAVGVPEAAGSNLGC